MTGFISKRKMATEKTGEVTHWIKTIEEDNEGNLVIDLKEACEQLGWEIGDILEWIDNKDGTWLLKKKL
jgi:DNA-binding Xre family transcriptional regulator